MEVTRHVALLLLLVILATSKLVNSEEERAGRCPPLVKWGVCPTGAESCNFNDDCGDDQLCCESPCGSKCSQPLFTGCEHLQMSASRRARALGPDGRSVRIPRCTKDGDFDPVQCDNEIVGSCWCVDQEGFELPGTRAPARGLVNCTAPAACAAATCRMLCPHGFALAADGCPLCQCRDPCHGVRCPGQLSCQLETVACLKQPCPPVPTCKKGRSLENICPVGEPLMITDSPRPFLCGTDPGKPTCPPLYQCFVQRGNDYGVCCPASLKIKKPGMCPRSSSVNSTMEIECEAPCGHDLECPSMQKCCHSESCGKRCVFPDNLTECLQQKALAEVLSVSERAGRGYIPQCSDVDGSFEARQCSRNGVVCWCVDKQGLKMKGSMGPSAKVDCSKYQGEKSRSSGRSLVSNSCDRNICASICEYGFKVDSDGCPTCECDDPCQGFPCKQGEECIAVKEQGCQDNLCTSYPMCRPKVTYVNPCYRDTPLTNETTGEVVTCSLDLENQCPSSYRCVSVAKRDSGVCCTDDDMMEEDEDEDYSTKPGLCPFDVNKLCTANETTSCISDSECPSTQKCCMTSNCGSLCAEADIRRLEVEIEEDRSPSMCEYLRDFNDKMEGTHDGMKLALPTPTCHNNGSFEATQCTVGIDGVNKCWCVDYFGTEIPKTKGVGNPTTDCIKLRESLECLELSCRLGCDYGFVMNEDTQCTICQCRDPCEDVQCKEGHECQMVDVACDNDYCPPVPACLAQKVGQCPYLVPPPSGSCDYECSSDAQCSGAHRCCSNGCGTQCIQPLLKTACQHQQAIALHKAAESGIPARQLYVPACREIDGRFETVQCHPAANICWCVDESGQEIEGTRTKGPQRPVCQNPLSCPDKMCTKQCEHGFALDDKGCNTCECKDLCAEMKCPNEGEVCKVVNVQCVRAPCPPLAMCVASDDMGPCGKDGGKPAQVCGPSEPPCPSSHKCNLSPLMHDKNNPPVCCPKPRSVCFDSKDEGICHHTTSNLPNTTIRWYFNPEKNQCQQFRYEGCSGNHNNFMTEDICNKVCPVLSQCERLREKNQKAAIRYKKDTFTPRCQAESGDWEQVQCMDHIGVCWCVTSKGEPLKGSLVRGSKPICNFRQARRRMDAPPEISSANEVLEELVKQMTAYNFIDSMEEEDTMESEEGLKLKSRCLSIQEQMSLSSASYEVNCDSNGRYTPTQCESTNNDAKCWCVDEAGNQLPGTSTFTRGDNICLPTPIEAVDITLGFLGEFSGPIGDKMKEQLLKDLDSLGATVKDRVIKVYKEPDVTYIQFTLTGANKVDISYHLEELVKQEELTLSKDLLESEEEMIADIKKSKFHHKLAIAESNKSIIDNKIIALQHREILSESTVSVVTSYHTAIIVLAAASAFIISTMSVMIMLYRKKVSSMNKTAGMGMSSIADRDREKITSYSDRFLPYNTPVFVLSNNTSKQQPDN